VERFQFNATPMAVNDRLMKFDKQRLDADHPLSVIGEARSGSPEVVFA